MRGKTEWKALQEVAERLTAHASKIAQLGV